MKCIDLSSSESELVGEADAATWVHRLIKLFKELRLSIVLPIRFEQDNLSTIQIIRNGPSFRHGKRMTIKGEFTHKMEVEGLIEITYSFLLAVFPYGNIVAFVYSQGILP